MDNLIFSILIEPKEWKNSKKRQYFKNKDILRKSKEAYAKHVNADFLLFEEDWQFEVFKNQYGKYNLSKHELINHYKVYLLNSNSDFYKNVLYLDFDVVWANLEMNIFNEFDLDNKFLVSKTTREDVGWLNIGKKETAYKILNKKVLDKWWFNTGVMGASRKVMNQLNYFHYFDTVVEKLDDLYNNKGWPNIGYSNEIFFSYINEFVDVDWENINYDSYWHRVTNGIPKHDKKCVFLHLRAAKDFKYLNETFISNRIKHN